MTTQSLICLAGFKLLCHEPTQMTVERCSDTPLLVFHIQAGGFDGDLLALLPHLDPGSLLLPGLVARSSVGA